MYLLLPIFGLIATNVALKADIRADTNRDGIVDIHEESDSVNKTTWSDKHGAIFLANIGDTDRRCSRIAFQSSLSNEELETCHDASDDIQRAPQFMAPLHTIPIPRISDSATGSISVPDPGQRPYVRIFHKSAAQWTIVNDNDKFCASDLKKGLVLGIDGRDTRRPGGWDGFAKVRFTVIDGDQSSIDDVLLRVAPVLTHHHLQNVEQVLTVRGNNTVTPWQNKFTQDLSAAVKNAGLSEPVYLFNGSDDVWAQDFVEPGYASMPGPNGLISLRIMVRSGQDDRVAGRQVFEYLRNTGIGAVQHLGGTRDEINSMGNHECIPPFAHNGTIWPNGRIIMGSHGTYHHHMLEYFRAQKVQDPLLLDTRWLSVGHVDEFVQFLPAHSRRGWVIMVDDPKKGINLLKETQAAGHGRTLMYSRRNDTQASNPSCDDFIFGCVSIPVSTLTVDEVLANEELLGINVEAEERIEGNIDILKEATGITDAEIYRIPALFQQFDITSVPSGLDIPPANRTKGDEKLSLRAVYPGIINGVVLTGHGTYIAPNPWGPLVNGTDIFATAARKEYAKLGLNVNFIDDWNTHHMYGGEIHCGTNTIRQIDQPWW